MATLTDEYDQYVAEDNQDFEMPQPVPQPMVVAPPSYQSEPAIPPTPQGSGFTYMGAPEGEAAARAAFLQQNPRYTPASLSGGMGPNAQEYARYQAANPVDPAQEAMQTMTSLSQRLGQEGNLNLSQAEESYKAAQKFLIIRMMQKAQENGMASDEIARIYLPQLLTLQGNAASIAPAMKAMTVPPQKIDPRDLIDYRAASQRFNAGASGLIQPLPSKMDEQSRLARSTETRRQMIGARDEMNRLRQGGARVTAPTGDGNEVTKTLKNGRKAVFDSGTKQFLRYAD